MNADLLFAWLHHLCFIGMATALAMQWALLNPSLPRLSIAALGRADSCYGGLAGLLLIVGTVRVMAGPKGLDFYLANPFFHAKIGLFVLVGLVSVLPTLRYLRWKRQARADAGFQPAAAEIGKVRGAIKLQALGWLALPLLAAAMTRGF